LFNTENEGQKSSPLNRELAKAFLRGSDPQMATRPWAEAMNELSSHGKESSQKRCRREMLSKAFDITGITRGKHLVVLIGQRKVLAMAVSLHYSKKTCCFLRKSTGEPSEAWNHSDTQLYTKSVLNERPGFNGENVYQPVLKLLGCGCPL
jgi:hypothetical protein